MLGSVTRLSDDLGKSSCVPLSIHAVGDVLNHELKLVNATVPLPEIIVEIKAKTISFCKLSRSLENHFLNELTEGRKKANLSITGGKLQRLSSSRDADSHRNFSLVEEIL